MTKANEVK